MSASTSPWVHRNLFLGFLWGGEAIGSLFVFTRFAIRVKAFHKLFSDDGLVFLAWLCSLAACITWQMIVTGLYNQYKLTTGTLPLTPDVLKKEEDLLHGSVAFQILFHTCVYSIKASFLLFFRRLDSLEGPRRKWWWFVAVITLGAYLSSIGTTQWKCLLGSLEYIFTQCSNADSLKYEHTTFVYQMCIDVITDALILSIPVIMLWNVRVRLLKKIALMGLFSLTVIVMGTSIARVSVIPTAHTQADVSWLYLWHNLEMSVTLLVSSLASFRQLYVTKSQKSPSPQRTKRFDWTSTFKKYFLSTRSASRTLSTAQLPHLATWNEDSVLPLESIHVSPNVCTPTASTKD